MAELPAFTTARLQRIAEDAPRTAGVLGSLPTPLEALHPVAGIRALEALPALPERVRTPGRRLLGALWFEERTIFLEDRQSMARRRFTEADELFRPAVDRIEAEANAGAAMLLFQGRHFADRLAGERPSIGAPLALAREYGASAHAALHHYVAGHAAALAMVVVGRFPQRDGSLPVWRSVESRRWRRRFDSAAAMLRHGLPAGSPLRELVEAARRASDPPIARLPWPCDRAGVRRFVAQAHYNRHAFLVLLEPG